MEIVLLWVLFAVFSGVLANSKNRNVGLWTLIGLLCGPFGLLVAFMPAQLAVSSSSGLPLPLCTQCQEPIQFNARVCKHCATRFPSLTEPTRSHVHMISDLYIKGARAAEITDTLNRQGIRPVNKDAWTIVDIESLIHDHVASNE